MDEEAVARVEESEDETTDPAPAAAAAEPAPAGDETEPAPDAEPAPADDETEPTPKKVQCCRFVHLNGWAHAKAEISYVGKSVTKKGLETFIKAVVDQETRARESTAVEIENRFKSLEAIIKQQTDTIGRQDNAIERLEARNRQLADICEHLVGSIQKAEAVASNAKINQALCEGRIVELQGRMEHQTLNARPARQAVPAAAPKPSEAPRARADDDDDRNRISQLCSHFYLQRRYSTVRRQPGTSARRPVPLQRVRRQRCQRDLPAVALALCYSEL